MAHHRDRVGRVVLTACDASDEFHRALSSACCFGRSFSAASSLRLPKRCVSVRFAGYSCCAHSPIRASTMRPWCAGPSRSAIRGCAATYAPPTERCTHVTRSPPPRPTRLPPPAVTATRGSRPDLSWRPDGQLDSRHVCQGHRARYCRQPPCPVMSRCCSARCRGNRIPGTTRPSTSSTGPRYRSGGSCSTTRRRTWTGTS